MSGPLAKLLLGAALLVAPAALSASAAAAETRLPSTAVIARDGMSADGNILATVDPQSTGVCWTARLYARSGGTWAGAAEGAGPARPPSGQCSPVVAVLAADGRTLAVHAVWDDIVYLLERDGARLAQATAITLRGQRGPTFPPPTSSLAISADGELLLVGAANFDCELAVPQDACGTALLYGRDAQGWSSLATFPRPDGAGIVQRFGEAIAMDAAGRTMAIGGTGLLGEPGHLFLYHAVEGAMEQVQELRPETKDSVFGTDLAMSADGELLAVGGDQRVYLYARDGQRWLAPVVVTESAPRVGTFGGAVALSGDGRWLLVGAPRSNCENGPPRCGMAFRYLVNRSGKSVTTGAPTPVEPDQPVPLSDFGWRIAPDRLGRLVAIQGRLAHVFGP